MLHLTRKPGELIVIGNGQSVRVVQIDRDECVTLRVWDAERAEGSQEFEVRGRIGEEVLLREVRLLIESIGHGRVSRVSFGFDAPPEIAVQRLEKYLREAAR